MVYKFGEFASNNLGVYAVKTCNFLPQFGRNLTMIFIRHVGFRNVLENRNFDFSTVLSNHFCTSCRNLVKFGSVISEFKTLEFVQSASKKFSGVTRYVQ